MFKLLLSAGADPNERDQVTAPSCVSCLLVHHLQWGNSILMIISRTGHHDLLMALLESDLVNRNIDLHYQNPVSPRLLRVTCL
jgi:ankyrin repeat protein